MKKSVKKCLCVSAVAAGAVAISLATVAANERLRISAENTAVSEVSEDIEIKEILRSGTMLNAAIVTRMSDGEIVGYKELPAAEEEIAATEPDEQEETVNTAKIPTATANLTAARSYGTYANTAAVYSTPAPEPVAEETYQEPYYEEIPQEYTEYSEPAEEYCTPQEETYVYDGSNYDGAVLNPTMGVVYGPSGKETYYNLNMSGVVNIMRGMGNTDQYWVREDGAKMLGDYVIVAADLDTHPRGSLVETSLGTGIVCDTGGFAYSDPNQIDIATAW